MMKSTTSAVWALAWLCLPWGPMAWGVGSIEGHCGFERVKGVSEMGMVELYEWNLFLSPDAPGVGGRFCRLGAVPGVGTTHDGYYRIDNVPAGTYSIYISQPDFFASPTVVPNVRISDGQPMTLTVLLDVDYSCFWREDGWTDWGPWDWYQTFRATGTAVRGVTWRMAGSGLYNGKTAHVRILEDNGQPDVRQWKEVGSGTDGQLGADSDEWVRWPSGQVPLTHGKMYAVNIHIDGGLAIYKRNKDANSYAHGRAYDGDGNPRDFDLHMAVFVDRNRQAVTHTRRSPGPGNLAGQGGTSWGQTFIATGTSLAAVDLFEANGIEPTFELTWTVRQGGPAGPRIGPEKTAQGAYFASSADLCGVSYQPGQVPLTPGQCYYIEARNPQDQSFTAFLQEPWNRYDDGQAYRNAAPVTNEDLAMTIVEYTHPAPSETGLAGWWPAEQILDGNLNDGSGQNRDGAIQGEPGIVEGVHGNALHMDGHDGVTITGYKGITGNAPRTCAVWARFAPQDTDSVILRWGDSGPGMLWQWRLFPVGSTAHLRLAVGGGYIQTRNAIDTDRWTHLAVVLPGDAQGVEDVRVYVDGVRQRADALEVHPQPIATAICEDVRLGTNGSEFMEGALDDVALFDVALSDAQIARLYALGARSFLQPCGGALFDPAVAAPGDLDRDCFVGLADLSLISEAWLVEGISAVDVTADGLVDVVDVRALVQDWLKPVGLQGHWTFDDWPGHFAADTSGYGRRATLVRILPIHWIEGKIGGALEFAGTGYYAEIEGYQGIMGAHARTCCAWVKITQIPGAVVGWGRADEPQAAWDMRINARGLLRLQVNDGAVFGSTRVDTGQWVHVAAVLPDGADRLDAVRLYVNGRLEPPEQRTLQTALINTTAGMLVRIGANTDGLGLTGALDDVRLYDRALTDAEIAALAAAP